MESRDVAVASVKRNRRDDALPERRLTHEEAMEAAPFEIELCRYLIIGLRACLSKQRGKLSCAYLIGKVLL
jgi:hypothetical protein